MGQAYELSVYQNFAKGDDGRYVIADTKTRWGSVVSPTMLPRTVMKKVRHLFTGPLMTPTHKFPRTKIESVPVAGAFKGGLLVQYGGKRLLVCSEDVRNLQQDVVGRSVTVLDFGGDVVKVITPYKDITREVGRLCFGGNGNTGFHVKGGKFFLKKPPSHPDLTTAQAVLSYLTPLEPTEIRTIRLR